MAIKRKVKRTPKPKFLTWTVRFSVHQSWVEDGFDLDDERALDMLAHDLSYAYGHELKAKVLSKPDSKIIKELQGY